MIIAWRSRQIVPHRIPQVAHNQAGEETIFVGTAALTGACSSALRITGCRRIAELDRAGNVVLNREPLMRPSAAKRMMIATITAQVLTVDGGRMDYIGYG